MRSLLHVHARRFLAFVVAVAIWPLAARAQSTPNLAVLRGLLPFSELLDSTAGRGALDANYSITGAIASGTARQPTLETFAAQRQQALDDAYITAANALQLADGLGPTLEQSYRSVAKCPKPENGVPSRCTMALESVAELLTYALSLSEADSNSAKYFFANGRMSANGKSLPLAGPAATFLTAAGGTTDAYGAAYQHPAGSNGADPFGDSRPFQTEPASEVPAYSGADYFGAPTTNTAYLSGNAADLTMSPAFPSGHTTYGFTESVLLGVMVPERYPQMVARAAEYGNDRIILGAHYAMDVIGGRTLALYDLAHLFAGYPAYAGLQFGQSTIGDFGVALTAARNDLRRSLAAGCGDTLTACANDAKNRFGDPAAVKKFYESTQTYGLPVVFASTAGTVEDVGKIAPEAGSLLTAAFPALSIAQADRILTETEGPGGGFLDDGSCFGVYSRLNLYEAALRAEKLVASP